VSLFRWGWNSYFEAMWSDLDRENTVPARVVAQHRGLWRAAGAFGEPSGKLRRAAPEGADWPAVGDWLSVDPPEASAPAVIHAVLPRRNRFIRKSPGKKFASKIIASSCANKNFSCARSIPQPAPKKSSASNA
jgi:ribosome biogenesis GTPase